MPSLLGGFLIRIAHNFFESQVALSKVHSDVKQWRMILTSKPCSTENQTGCLTFQSCFSFFKIQFVLDCFHRLLNVFFQTPNAYYLTVPVADPQVCERTVCRMTNRLQQGVTFLWKVTIIFLWNGYGHSLRRKRVCWLQDDIFWRIWSVFWSYNQRRLRYSGWLRQLQLVTVKLVVDSSHCCFYNVCQSFQLKRQAQLTGREGK